MRHFTDTELLVATHNAGKLEEIRALIAPYGVQVVSAADKGLQEPDETETTFIGNATIKAMTAVRATGLPALADDSGIEIEGLDGAPGVYTADWAETPNGRDFEMAMRKSWGMLEERQAPHPRKARFCCTFVLAWPDEHREVFAGHVDGTFIWPMRGKLGHGYDPIFQPDGFDRTFAEMSDTEKNAISHRARAFEKLARAFAG